MQKYKTNHVDGYELRTLNLKNGRLQRAGNWVAENSMEVLMGILFIAMVYAIGMMMSTTAQAVDLMIEYAEIEPSETVEQYQDRKVYEALIEHRMEEMGKQAEQPPYWTAPAESY